MVARKKYPALGRGLDALIDTGDEIRTSGSSSINEISVDNIVPNPNQPRHEFDEEALNELAESIRQLGIVQPVVLRRMDDGTYQIIAGERRWRASKIAGLTTIPAYIRTASDENMMQMALVENIQREDLNAIEVALAYQKLIEQYHLTQETLSEKVGKKRATVANALRLLKLPAPVQMALRNKTISQGHARAILSTQEPREQLRLFREVMKNGYSVRQVEEMARQINAGETPTTSQTKVGRPSRRLPEEYHELQQKLATFFQSKVKMSCSKEGRGSISIPFNNPEELERLIELFDKLH